SSRFLPDVAKSAQAGVANRKVVQAAPPISARQAIVLAAKSIGPDLAEDQILAVDAAPEGEQKSQRFTAAPVLSGEIRIHLVWLPMDQSSMRLCWQLELTSRDRGEMFLVLVDVQSGDIPIRRCLTEYISDATYRVFTSDSPSPFSPGHPVPLTNQPALVSRLFLTGPALDTNASPNGWINDADNETRGNNVEAHTDWNNDNLPDLPRPQGATTNRVFDFPLDLTMEPTNYASASVVQLFYWCNWMHDRLYRLGF